MPGVFVLALRPDLRRAVWHCLVRGQEVEPLLGPCAVLDVKRPRLGSGRDRDTQLLAVVDEACFLGASPRVQLHRGYLEGDRVQHQLAGGFAAELGGADAFEVEACAACDSFPVEVEA